MPTPPHPFTLTCKYCSWGKTILPRSDVLVLGQDWFTSCPKCRAPSLERRHATQKETLKARLEQFFTLSGS